MLKTLSDIQSSAATLLRYSLIVAMVAWLWAIVYHVLVRLGVPLSLMAYVEWYIYPWSIIMAAPVVFSAALAAATYAKQQTSDRSE
jgi:uncharacterized RDD family membrane protein YckC